MIKIDDPIFLKSVYCYDDVDKMLKAVRRRGYEINRDDVSRQEGVTVDIGDIYMFIKPDKKNRMLDTIHHESIHASMSILTRAGVRFDDQEVLAYHSGFIFSNLVKKIWK